MTTIKHNISKMIGAYPTSYRSLSKYEGLIQEAVERRIAYTLTNEEMDTLMYHIENETNDYFVKAFRKQFTFEEAADLQHEQAIHFAVWLRNRSHLKGGATMNLSLLMNKLNLHRGISDVHKMTNELIREEVLGNAKMEAIPLLMSLEVEQAVQTRGFKEALTLLLFDNKNIKEISEAFVQEVGFALPNHKQDELRTALQSVIKEAKKDFSKKIHKPWVLELIETKEQDAKNYLANRLAM